MIKVIVALVSIWSVVACKIQATDGSTMLMFDGTKLSVPNKYILPGLPSSFFPKEGLDISRAGGLISIPIEDLGITKRGSGGFYENIIVLISGSNGQIGFSGFKAWNGKGLFSNRIIEFDDQLNLYKVHAKSGYPVSWEYFKVSPIDGSDYLPNWVSSCTLPVKSDIFKNPKFTCKTESQYKTVRSRITFSGEYVDILDSIIENYNSLLSSWESEANQE